MPQFWRWETILVLSALSFVDVAALWSSAGAYIALSVGAATAFAGFLLTRVKPEENGEEIHIQPIIGS